MDKRWIYGIVGAIGVGVVGYFGYEYFVNGETPAQILSSGVQNLNSSLNLPNISTSGFESGGGGGSTPTDINDTSTSTSTSNSNSVSTTTAQQIVQAIQQSGSQATEVPKSLVSQSSLAQALQGSGYTGYKGSVIPKKDILKEYKVPVINPNNVGILNTNSGTYVISAESQTLNNNLYSDLISAGYNSALANTLGTTYGSQFASGKITLQQVMNKSPLSTSSSSTSLTTSTGAPVTENDLKITGLAYWKDLTGKSLASVKPSSSKSNAITSNPINGENLSNIYLTLLNNSAVSDILTSNPLNTSQNIGNVTAISGINAGKSIYSSTPFLNSILLNTNTSDSFNYTNALSNYAVLKSSIGLLPNTKTSTTVSSTNSSNKTTTTTAKSTSTSTKKSTSNPWWNPWGIW